MIMRIKSATRRLWPLREKRSMVCIGHSHLVSVTQAAEDQNLDLTVINLWFAGDPFVGVEDGAVRFRPDIEQKLKGGVFSFIGGSAYAVLGLLTHPEPFDFVLPDALGLPIIEKARLIPVSAIRASLEVLALDYFAQMKLIRAASSGSVFHIEPPPPYPDGARMLPDVRWDLMGDRGKEIAPRHFRYKLWLLHNQIVREFCRQNGITYISHPPEVTDGEGFLLPAYYSDATHANKAYGALVLEQMRRVV